MFAFANRICAVALGTLLATGVASPAFGWGQTGHRVTGAIAQQYLSPLSQAAMMELLPNSSLAQASTHADEMRSDPSEFWQKTAGPWHYVSVPEGKTYVEVGAPDEGDAVTALEQFTNTLKDPSATTDEKRLALQFIVHIIGDLHQPLHAGNGTDRGGNDVKVRFFWQDSNLHRVWDSQMLEQRGLSYTEWTAQLTRSITPQDIRNWASTDVLEWIKESTEIRDTIYPDNANNMSYDYLYNNLPTAQKRIQMAGIRIAMYLNKVFEEANQ
ncbi:MULTISPECIES: S1/P1 nuclease [unclassified Alteromonas]|uniref:S1/P1 nuclease n=1 Tax=unclassified Alteromonas TaxID=2614992 RepID=UPI001923AAA8|nr:MULTISPECIES: S1/P1 nuclease [unclassified Alteromonas]WDT86340.1 S1/P1 nuclease [Alteromonas sp. 009811495]BCO17322.1 endonuclease [Alteromonas sp. KC3]BCO21311.1 endonuclease [Alteromonas sp. KC14]